MRKSLVLTLLLLAASIGCISFARNTVNRARDQVMFTENVICGDKAVAEGLKVRCDAHYNHRLFWSTTCTIAAADPLCDTEYNFSWRQLRQTPPEIHSGVIMRTVLQHADEHYPGIGAALRKLADETPAGQENARVIRLKDYCAYYPLDVSLSFPGTRMAWSGSVSIDINDPEPGTDAYVILRFQEFFRIPVIEDELVMIAVTKDADDRVKSYRLGSTNSDSFRMRSESIVIDGACYFTFNTRTSDGDIVDTSLIPGGYGIYCLPYFDGRTEHGRINGAKVDELSMVYPLDPAVEFLDLGLSLDKARLLLHTVENGKYVLTVIDIATMTALQRIEVFDWPERDQGWWVYEGDGFFTAVLPDQRLAVLALDDEGLYELRFTAEVRNGEDPLGALRPEAVMDYDGRRLAVAGFLQRKSGHPTCDFYLAVYDESGLAYYAEYLSSLSRGDEPGWHRGFCEPVDYHPIGVTWD